MTKTCLSVTLALTVTLLPAIAEDWTTNDGKTYREITVIRHDSLTVTILFEDGGATVDLANLSPDLQKRFGFDAKAAADLKAQQDAQAAADLKAKQTAVAIKAQQDAQVAAELKAQQDATARKAQQDAKAAADLQAQQNARAAVDLKAQQDAQAAQDKVNAKKEADEQQTLEAANQKAKAAYDSTDKTTVNGQIFIATQGGDNVKLGLIHVHLLSREQAYAAIYVFDATLIAEQSKLQPIIDAQKAHCIKLNNELTSDSGNVDSTDVSTKYNDAVAQYKDSLTKYYYYMSTSAYLESLPTPLDESISDADGKFSVKIPKTGSWMLEAEGQRTVGDKIEEYFWLADVSSDAIAKNQIFLSNENLYTAESTHFMLNTDDKSDLDFLVSDKVSKVLDKDDKQ